jgi:putative hemolysin
MAARLIGGLQRSRSILVPPSFSPAPKPRPANGLGPVLGRIGSLEVRLAVTRKDVMRAQKLRYSVFYEEMSAIPDMMCRLTRRDMDAFDALCDHLLVVDHAAAAPSFQPFASGPDGKKRRKPRVVGTYRLLRQEVAERHGGFYTESEFDIGRLVAAHPGRRFLELGRSCVLRPYRDKRTVELLWHGIWAYVLHHRVDVMFGCASLEGTDPARLAVPLSFLHHSARAEDGWRVRPVDGRGVSMDRLPAGAVQPRAAMQALPPLIKGYLRVGARFGDGAVVDHQFGTTDVLVVLPVETINPRYIGHFGADASRHAA